MACRLVFKPLSEPMLEHCQLEPILIEIQLFSLKKIRLKMLSVKCCPFHLGLNVESD